MSEPKSVSVKSMVPPYGSSDKAKSNSSRSSCLLSTCMAESALFFVGVSPRVAGMVSVSLSAGESGTDAPDTLDIV